MFIAFVDTPKKPDIRAYLNPLPPRFSKEAQAKQLAGTPYIEDMGGKVINAVIRSVRQGTIVEVGELFLLAPAKGHTKTRRAALVDRLDRIEERGGIVRELSTGHDTGKKQRAMLLRAYEMMGRSGQGAPGKRKEGRPKFEYTDHEWAIMEGEWHSSKHANTDERLAAMAKRMTKKPLGQTSLRIKFGPAGKRR